MRFASQTEKHELSHLYEAKIKNMGNARRNGGVYYKPRPLIRTMSKVLDPKIGERIYASACGSAGFLCDAFDYLLAKANKADDLRTPRPRPPRLRMAAQGQCRNFLQITPQWFGCGGASD